MDPVTVIVESRDLDTDAREREIHRVEPPRDELHQHRQLVALVARSHPGARPRSFANGAATFLGRQHLIVAFYENREPVPRRRAEPATPAGVQHQLFSS